jgi:hypothetical protein
MTHALKIDQAAIDFNEYNMLMQLYQLVNPEFISLKLFLRE